MENFQFKAEQFSFKDVRMMWYWLQNVLDSWLVFALRPKGIKALENNAVQ